LYDRPLTIEQNLTLLAAAPTRLANLTNGLSPAQLLAPPKPGEWSARDVLAHLPIGYWLKQADNLITEQVNKVQADNGISRFDWQVLNTLHEVGPVSKDRIFEVMSTFVDAAGLDAILVHLAERGWAESIESGQAGIVTYQLTHEGERRHSVILAAQKEARQRTVQGISEEEYATVIRVLQQIVSNLGETQSRNPA
jgi:DNA-binding MarR family transcriptional regulator